MLTAELKVNGVLIGVLQIHNTSDRVKHPTVADMYLYTTVYHRLDRAEAPQTGAFNHSRADGAAVCVEKALKSLR